MLKWVFLAGCIATEVSGTTFMKLSQGFERPAWTVAALACYAGTLLFMTLALKRLEIGTVYALWSGFGITLTTAVGAMWFGEALTVLKGIGVLLIIGGAVLLNLGRVAS